MLKQFEFGFVLDVINRLSPVIKQIEGQLGHLNESVKNTASMREFGENAVKIGAGMIAAGGGIGYALKSVYDAAASADEVYRHLATGLDDGAAGVRELAQAHEFAAAASVKFNYAQNDIVDNLYRSKSFIGDWNAALAVTNASLAVAKGNMGDAAQVGESLSIFFNDFANKSQPAITQAQHFADLIAFTSRHGAFENVNMLTAAVTASIGSAKAAGLGAKDLLATIQGFSQVGLQGTEAGTAIEETLAAFARGNLQKDLGVALARTKSGSLDIIGTLVNLRHAVGEGAISIEQFQRGAKALGIRGDRGLAVDVDKLVAFRKTLDSTAVDGAAIKGAMEMMGATTEQIGQLGKQWELFKEVLGDQLLGPVSKIAGYLGSAVAWATGMAKAHPEWVKFAMVTAAVGSALLVVAGGAVLLIGALAIAVSYIAPLAALGGVGWAIAAGVGAAAAAFGGLMAVFPTLRHFVVEAFSIGWDLIAAFAKGIWSNVMAPVHAVGYMAGLIKDLVVGHSPPPSGPLHQLNHVRIVETIAESIRPGPALAAMRRVAGAIAIAAPLAFSPMLAVPAMAASGARGGMSGAPVINVTQNITITGGDGATIASELRAHARELVQIIQSELAARGRTGF